MIAMENVQPKVMIVDDVESSIDILLAALGEEYDVRVSMDGHSALEHIRDDHPDIILLDIMMPGIDGYEVCRRLKEDESTADIPVIFVTVMGEITDETKGFEAGAVDYITKPISAPIVKARVNTHLLIKKQQDKLKKSISLLQHETEILQQKAEIGIQAGGLAHDMANILSCGALVQFIQDTIPENNDEWQKIRDELATISSTITLGIEICQGFTSYLKDIGSEFQEHPFADILSPLDMYTRQFRGKLVREVENNLPGVKCKLYQLKRVIVNLFVNAMQALDGQKNPEISVRLWHETDQVFLSVKDNGTGISPDILPSIFNERFTTKPFCNGLGLFLVKQIIDAHHGSIEVLSAIGNGTEVVVSLPVVIKT